MKSDIRYNKSECAYIHNVNHTTNMAWV